MPDVVGTLRAPRRLRRLEMVSPVLLLSAVLLAPSIVPSLPTVVAMVLAPFTARISIVLLISCSHEVCADVIRSKW
ncbi:hypothetical protein [Methanopyrus kandleri]|uniref:hypothetical protein n=1 Tax=Methanopyrus kandleri TaxID=2320 RepID=UPI0011E53D71|nr:hypothetical protein [Methanopyrus kandleri]